MNVTTPFFMLVDDLYIVRKYRRSFVWNYIYHMAMAILAITNVIFFVYNWYNIKIVVDETTMMLAFVGFLFAFAGINIYSIFNTNVESEKETLRELASQYEDSLGILDSFMLNIKKLGVMQQIGLLITTSPSMTSQHYSWLRKCEKLYYSQEQFLREMYKAGARDKAIEYLADFTDVCQGISVSLIAYIERIKKDKIYFNPAFGKEDRQDYIDKVSNLKGLMDKVIVFSFDEDANDDNDDVVKLGKLTTCEKLKTIWFDIKSLFKK